MAEVAEPAERKQRGRREPNEERIRARNQRLILKAAIEVFSKKGFDGTPISEIAEKSGLPKANVYYYFESKEAIYRAVIAHLIQGWDDALTHIRPEADPRTALEGYVRAKLEYTRKNASESRLFASEIIRGAEYLTRADRQHMKDVTDKAVAIVDGWVAAGQLKQVNARHLFIMLWSATQFYGDFEPLAADALLVKRLTSRHYEDAARTIVDTVLGGILAASA
jgi:TetR/AcrR family transcriptional regulator